VGHVFKIVQGVMLFISLSSDVTYVVASVGLKLQQNYVKESTNQREVCLSWPAARKRKRAADWTRPRQICVMLLLSETGFTSDSSERTSQNPAVVSNIKDEQSERVLILTVVAYFMKKWYAE
jgi:hypothetical protein